MTPIEIISVLDRCIVNSDRNLTDDIYKAKLEIYHKDCKLVIGSVLSSVVLYMRDLLAHVYIDNGNSFTEEFTSAIKKVDLTYEPYMVAKALRDLIVMSIDAGKYCESSGFINELQQHLIRIESTKEMFKIPALAEILFDSRSRENFEVQMDYLLTYSKNIK